MSNKTNYAGRNATVQHTAGYALAGVIVKLDRDEIVLQNAALVPGDRPDAEHTPVDGEVIVDRMHAEWIQVL